MLNALLFATHFITFGAQADITLEVTANAAKNANFVFFAPHEDENVANDYVKKRVESDGGAFYVLRQHGNRLIELSVEDDIVRVDPNRIYTPLGVKKTLAKLNPELKKNTPKFAKAASKAESLGRFILSKLLANTDIKVIVAMHNNTQGYDNDGQGGIGTVSIKRYALKHDAKADYIADISIGEQDEDDLFFVTSLADFEQLKKDQWNAVLQSKAVAQLLSEDDGSLSVYAEMKGIRYLNVEAERQLDDVGSDHLNEQKQMVNLVFDKLLRN